MNNSCSGEWACLGASCIPAPTHGFAIAARLKPDGDVGRVWSLSRALTYRSLEQLAIRGYVQRRRARTRHRRRQPHDPRRHPHRTRPAAQVAGDTRRPPPRPAQRTAAEVDHRRDCATSTSPRCSTNSAPVSPSWPNCSRPVSRPSPVTSSRSAQGIIDRRVAVPGSSARRHRLTPSGFDRTS